MTYDHRRGAFPMPPTSGSFEERGLTQRQYYAALAMQGFLSNPSVVEQFKTPSAVAEAAARMADAMLDELGQR